MRNDSNTDLSVAAAQHVVATDFGGGLALLNMHTHHYFSLDDVGAFIWQFLKTPRRRSEIIEELVAHYDVTPEICAHDLDSLLEELHDAALIEARSGAVS